MHYLLFTFYEFHFTYRLFLCSNFLRLTILNDDTGVTPTEIVKVPEGIDGNKEGKEWSGKDVLKLCKLE
jgi:hypothetical protein